MMKFLTVNKSCKKESFSNLRTFSSSFNLQVAFWIAGLCVYYSQTESNCD